MCASLGRLGEELKRPGPSFNRPPRIREQGRSHILQFFLTSTKDLPSFIHPAELEEESAPLCQTYLFSSIFSIFMMIHITFINKNVLWNFFSKLKQIRTKQSKVDKNRQKNWNSLKRSSVVLTPITVYSGHHCVHSSRVIIFLKFIKLASRTFESNRVWPLSAFWAFLRLGLHLRTRTYRDNNR